MERMAGTPRGLAAGAVLGALATLTPLAAAACRAQQVAYDGTYAVAYAGGTVTLALRTDADGAVRGWFQAPGAARFPLEGRLATDEDGQVTVEGSVAGAAGRTGFALFRNEDGSYGLLLTPYDATGTPRADLAAIYSATRTSDSPPDLAAGAVGAATPNPPGAAGPPGASNPPAASHPARPPGPAALDPSRDPRLVGTWSTQVVMNSAAGSIATELRMAFRADGALLDLGSRSLGSVGGGSFDLGYGGAHQAVAWRADGAVMTISYAGGPWTPFARYTIAGDRLILVYLHDGTRQTWSRVR